MMGGHAGGAPAADAEASATVKDIPPDSDAEPSGASEDGDSMSEEEAATQVNHASSAMLLCPAHEVSHVRKQCLPHIRLL